MRTKTAALVLTASMVAGGGAALAVPAFAQTADSTTSAGSSATDRAAARLTAIKTALAGLVADGTITQQQADRVAGTLAESDLRLGGRHGRGVGRVSPGDDRVDPRRDRPGAA